MNKFEITMFDLVKTRAMRAKRLARARARGRNRYNDDFACCAPRTCVIIDCRLCIDNSASEQACCECMHVRTDFLTGPSLV